MTCVTRCDEAPLTSLPGLPPPQSCAAAPTDGHGRRLLRWPGGYTAIRGTSQRWPRRSRLDRFRDERRPIPSRPNQVQVELGIRCAHGCLLRWPGGWAARRLETAATLAKSTCVDYPSRRRADFAWVAATWSPGSPPPAERPGVARRLETAATLAKSTCVDLFPVGGGRLRIGCCDLGRRAAQPAGRPGVARRLETAATLAKSTCVDYSQSAAADFAWVAATSVAGQPSRPSAREWLGGWKPQPPSQSPPAWTIPSRRRPTSHRLLRPRSPGSPAGRAPGSGPAVRNRGHPRKVHLRGLSQSAAGRLRMGCCDLGRRVPPQTQHGDHLTMTAVLHARINCQTLRSFTTQTGRPPASQPHLSAPGRGSTASGRPPTRPPAPAARPRPQSAAS